MNELQKAVSGLSEIDALAALNSPVHRLHPAVKLFSTLFYIAVTVSFPKYNVSGLLIMVLWPIFLYQLAGIPISTCFYKLRLVLPLVLFVGLFNPFFDHTPFFTLRSGIPVTGGMISMLTLLLKGCFCLMASFLLIATTTIDDLCAALRKMHFPAMLVTLLLLTYRYISLMLDQVSIMSDAYLLRAPGQKGIHISAWGSFLGQLLLRSMDRAQELYQAMQLRGFTGEFHYRDIRSINRMDILFAVLCTFLLLLFRFFNIPLALGSLVS